MQGTLKEITKDFKTKHTIVTIDTSESPENLEKYFDKPLDINIKVHRNRRSLSANGYFWMMCERLAEYMGISKEEEEVHLIHDYGTPEEPVQVRNEAFESMARLFKCYRIIDHNAYTGWTEVVFWKGTHLYDSKEMARLIDGTIKDMQENGLEVPPTRDIQRAIEEYERQRK